MRLFFINLILLCVFSPAFAQPKTTRLTGPIRITREINTFMDSYGCYLSITITSDSAIYKYHFGPGNSSVYKSVVDKTKGWPSLIKKLDMKKMDMMPPKESWINSETGGTDTVYKIEINNETHVLTNPDRSSPLYPQITPFINELASVIQNLRESTHEHPVSFSKSTNSVGSGHYRIEIRKDSIIYQPPIFNSPKDPKPLRGQTSSKDWDDIVKTFNAKNFASVKSRRTTAEYDGIDDYYSVQTNFGTYVIVNPGAEFYRILPYTRVFDRISKKFYKEIYKK